MANAPGRPLMARSNASWPYVVGSLIALLFVSIHWAQSGTVIAQIDLPPPYDPATMLGKCAFAWNHVHSYFGMIDNCFSWSPYLALQLALQKIAGDSTGQALLFAIPLIFSWLGAFNVARALGASPAAAFVGAWAYAFNPARQSMFGLFATGDAYAALLPWIWYWTIAAALEPAQRRKITIALAAVSFALLPILAITPQLLVALVVGLVPVLWFAVMRSADRRAYLVWAVRTLAIVIGVTLWWTVPNAMAYVGVGLTHPVDPSAVAWTFSRASLLNEMRFCAMWFWQYAHYNPWAIEFERNASFYASGFVPIAGLVLALVVCRGISLNTARFMGAFGLLALFVAKGLHAPFAWLNAAFYKIPGMFVFIEPYGPILIAALCLSVCCALAMEALLASGRRPPPGVGAALAVVFVALLWWNNAAAVTGAIFHERTNALPNVHIQLPGEWRDAARYIDSAGPGGVVVLPSDEFYQANYDWGYQGTDILPVELLDRDVLMPGAPVTYTQTDAARILDGAVTHLVDRRSPLAAVLLARLGIRFAIVRTDVHPFHGFMPDRADAGKSFGNGRPAVFGALEVYDLGPVSGRLRVESPRAESSAVSTYHIDTLASQTTRVSIDRDRLKPLDWPSGAPVPSLVGQIEVSSTAISYDVWNPAPVALHATILVGVWPRWQSTYDISVNGVAAGSSTVPASRVTEWARFPAITLQPGMNHLVVRALESTRQRFAAFLPPRFASGQPWSPHVNEIAFADIHPEHATIPRTGKSAVVDVHLSMDRDPVLELLPASPDASGPTAWRYGVRRGRASYECFDVWWTGQAIHLADSVRSCFASLGQNLNESDARPVVIDRLALAADAPYSARFASLTIEEASDSLSSSASELLATPRETQPQTLWNIPGLSVAVRVTQPATTFVLGESFSPTWIAFGFDGISPMPKHFLDDGWQNGWDCGGAGTILVFNWVPVFELLFFVIGLAGLVVLCARRS
jgi:hypothetical protein